MLTQVRRAGLTNKGFTVIELAIVVVIIAALFYIATFREGSIIGSGVLVSGLSLCVALAAQKKGWRLVSIVFIIGSIAAAVWMMRACTASMAAHARERSGR